MCLLLPLAFGLGTAASAQPVNPDFDTDLSGWSVAEHGGTVVPGSVTWEAGEAVIREGDSHLVVLAQVIWLPAHPEQLSFSLGADPGFDLAGRWLADALEVLLGALAGAPLLEGWQPGASAVFSLQESGEVLTAPCVASDGTTVAIDLSAHAGEDVTLSFALIGGDRDLTSTIRVDAVRLGDVDLAPGPPPAMISRWSVSAAGRPRRVSLSRPPR